MRSPPASLRHLGPAEELHLRRVAVRDGAAGRGERERAVGRDGADAHDVDLQAIGVRVVPQLLALHLHAQAPVLAEALQA